MPWFEPAIGALRDPSDRQAVYAAKHATRDTHCIVEFFAPTNPILYDEPGQPYQIPSLIHEATPDAFRGLVTEIIAAGFIPTVVFDGDDGDNPLGYPNALRQLPILATLLDGLHDRILYARFWDGVFYGSSPAHVQHFGQEFTRIIRQGGAAPGYLAIEFQPGHIPAGTGAADFAPGGLMTDYDTILGEFQCPTRASVGSDGAYADAMGNVWEICKRLASKTYTRPPDQPAGNDEGVEDYFAQPSPRGPYVFGVMETGGGGPAQPGVYDWVRGNCTLADLQRVGDYFRALGAPLVCLP